MIFGAIGIVFLIFLPSFGSRHVLANVVKKSGAKRLTVVGPCLVCKEHNSRIISDLANIAGADSVAKAKRVSRQFFDIISAITETGIETILPYEKFYVEVIRTTKLLDYVERDVEFASTGMLIEKLAKINARPARSQHEADRVITAVIGKRWTYVCAR